MQSSTAIAIRALVMLIVLISVPLFAIFGKNVPEVIKGLLEGRGLVLAPASGGDANQGTVAPLAAGNSLNQAAPYRVQSETSAAGRSDGRSDTGRSDTGHSDTGHSEISRSDLLRSAATATSGGQWHDPPAPNLSGPSGAVGMQPNGGVQSPGSMMQSPGAGVQPTGFQAPIGGPGSGSAQPQTPLRSETTLRNDLVQSTPYFAISPASRPGQPGAAPPGTSDERFRQAEVQLRQLGATYYMLETWGPDNNRYRFSCKMPIGGNAGVNRLFQAVDEDPLLAMNSVLRQISQWRVQNGQAVQ